MSRQFMIRLAALLLLLAYIPTTIQYGCHEATGDFSCPSGEPSSGEAGSGEYASGDFGSGSGEPAPPPGQPSPPPYRSPMPPPPPPNLVSSEVVDYLRAGDRRMVRPSNSGYTNKLREEYWATFRIDFVIKELIDQRTPHDVDISLPPLARAKAAEAITIYVTDHPANRAKIGGAAGVSRALVELVDRSWRDAVAHDPQVLTNQTDIMFLAAESAAEAIWILSFNSPANHASLIREGAIEALSGLVTARDVHGVATPPRAAMWAAAALQNLAASYCGETNDGRCPWDWPQGGTQLAVRDRVKVTVDSEAARVKIASMPKLIDSLARYACEGPVSPYDPLAGRASAYEGIPIGPTTQERMDAMFGVGVPWPSRARVDSRKHYAVVPWAAAGALKNIALSEYGANAIIGSENSSKCLCRLAVSRDWLESSKAQAALAFIRPRVAARGQFACPPSAPSGRGDRDLDEEGHQLDADRVDPVLKAMHERSHINWQDRNTERGGPYRHKYKPNVYPYERVYDEFRDGRLNEFKDEPLWSNTRPSEAHLRRPVPPPMPRGHADTGRYGPWDELRRYGDGIARDEL